MRFTVEFYDTPTGREPAKEFILGLDVKMRAKVSDMIDLLRNNGTELREPYSKYLSDGIFELRAKVGSDLSRVLFFFYSGQHIVLTNGFIKKTSRTPRSVIQKAKEYRTDYIQRKGDRNGNQF